MGQVTTSRQWDFKCQLQMIFGKGPGIYWLPSQCLDCLSLIPFLTVCFRSIANKQTGKQQHSLAGGDLLSPSTCKTAFSLSGAGTPGISSLDPLILPPSAGITRYYWAAPLACFFVAESMFEWYLPVRGHLSWWTELMDLGNFLFTHPCIRACIIMM